MTQTGDIPIMAAHNALIARVLKRNEIRQIDLANECGVSETLIHRIITGDRLVTPDIFSTLWRMTKDSELAAFVFGEPGYTVIEPVDASGYTEQQTLLLAVCSCSAVMQKADQRPKSKDEYIDRVSLIDDAIKRLLMLKSKFIDQVKPSNPYTHRSVVHQPTGLDVVA